MKLIRASDTSDYSAGENRGGMHRLIPTPRLLNARVMKSVACRYRDVAVFVGVLINPHSVCVDLGEFLLSHAVVCHRGVLG